MNSRWSFALALSLSVLVFSHADADHHKKKNKDNDAQLEQCTIVKSGGMGCVAPLKLVCQKKHGEKCCACVGDKNAQAPAKGPAPAEGPAPTQAPAKPAGPGCGETCSLQCKDADPKFLGVCFPVCFAGHSSICGGSAGCGETCSRACKDAANGQFLGVCFVTCFARHSNLCGG
jgi:hypothetical protein